MLCVNGHQEEMDEISESNRNLTEPSFITFDYFNRKESRDFNLF